MFTSAESANTVRTAVFEMPKTAQRLADKCREMRQFWGEGREVKSGRQGQGHQGTKLGTAEGTTQLRKSRRVYGVSGGHTVPLSTSAIILMGKWKMMTLISEHFGQCFWCCFFVCFVLDTYLFKKWSLNMFFMYCYYYFYHAKHYRYAYDILLLSKVLLFAVRCHWFTGFVNEEICIFYRIDFQLRIASNKIMHENSNRPLPNLWGNRCWNCKCERVSIVFELLQEK